MPVKWQRSSGTAALMNGGRYAGSKQYSALGLARQPKPVAASQTPSEPNASSWAFRSPVQ